GSPASSSPPRAGSVRARGPCRSNIAQPLRGWPHGSWSRNPLEVVSGPWAGVEEQIQDANPVLEGWMRLRILEISRVIHPVQLDARALEDIRHDIVPSGRA